MLSKQIKVESKSISFQTEEKEGALHLTIYTSFQRQFGSKLPKLTEGHITLTICIFAIMQKALV